MRGLKERYPSAKRQRVMQQVEEELETIREVGYEAYFLMVWDLLQACRREGISWITRGSAADSLVCYCLRISDVCPKRFELYFRRFLNRDRMALNKLPDIDVDFPMTARMMSFDWCFRSMGKSTQRWLEVFPLTILGERWGMLPRCWVFLNSKYVV